MIAPAVCRALVLAYCLASTVGWVQITQRARRHIVLPSQHHSKFMTAISLRATAAGLLPDFPDAMRDVSKSVCDAVKHAQLLSDPPFFMIGGDSPLARKANALHIPLHPLSNVANKLPYMLMYGLTKPNVTSFSSITHKATVRLQAAKKKTVLLGCAGAGKTRVAMEMLAEEFGIYLAIDDQQGWEDLSSLFAVIEKESNKTMSDSNMALLQELMECLVLSRLVVLDALLKQYPALTPAQWVWVQKHPRCIFKEPGSLIITLKAVWKLCREANRADAVGRAALIKTLIKALKQHMKSEEDLLCVVDEPQLLLELFHGRFRSAHGHPCSLYAPMMMQLEKMTDLVISGSSSQLLSQFIDDKLAEKPDAESQSFNVLTQSTALSASECRDFMHRFLDLSDVSSLQLDEMSEMLAGRPYFVERLVSATLARSANPMNLTGTALPEKYQKVYSVYRQLMIDQTTAEGRAIDMRLYLANSLHGAITRANGLSPYGSGIPQALLMQFKAAALNLWHTGQPEALPYHTAARLVDEGLANVVATERGPQVVVNELVVALAAKNFWEPSKAEAPS